MHLKILLPNTIFVQAQDVLRITADTNAGSCGLLPQRRDCVAALKPGIVVYETTTAGMAYVAVDEGVLVKTGDLVLVSVRRALQGDDLSQLHDVVEQEFLQPDEHEQNVRSVMAKLEAGFMRRFADMQHD